MSMTKPRIAVLLDENTSGGATRYEASKNCFRAIRDAGGLPFGIPYLPEIVDPVIRDFDGLFTVGGRFAYPDDWYAGPGVAKAPRSERFEVERALMQSYLDRDKPVLGICAGMQMLACLAGCRMSPDIGADRPGALPHDRRGRLHAVSVVPGTLLSAVVAEPWFMVNTLHREAVIELAEGVVAGAHAADGVVEAVEIPSRAFAVGLQWHQEAFAAEDHPGNAVFGRFVRACRRAV